MKIIKLPLILKVIENIIVVNDNETKKERPEFWKKFLEYKKAPWK